ncbi:MAG TPA: chemotaxis-specific protein-glutamate methyltransferase CheB [Geomonas sp.]|nr:chemotaxis-specific protein-glutamate methyltransferase CheB [Geomonas sp.]
MIRLLVVEDSTTVRKLLVSVFESDPQLSVVGTAESGEAAVQAVASLRPDVVTMDVNLPGMDGFEATRAIMSSFPVPVVIVTGKMDPKASGTLFRVMEAGALMVLPKPEPPGSPGYERSVADLVRHVKLMSEIKVVRRNFGRPPLPPPEPQLPQLAPAAKEQIKVVAIGASTGGPPLLRELMGQLPADFNAAVLVVQHMAEGFTEGFVHWLNQGSRLPVELAVAGSPILPGRVYVAPDGCHLEAGPGSRIHLSSAPPDQGLRPSVSALFRSVALRYGKQAVGVLLTGMGTDGVDGLKCMREQGAVTVAQDRESSVVYGMPGSAVKAGAALYVLPPQGILKLLCGLVQPSPPPTIRSSTDATR